MRPQGEWKQPPILNAWTAGVLAALLRHLFEIFSTRHVILPFVLLLTASESKLS